MRLSNHQKDATWDIWTALVSRGLAPGYGASRRVIFSLLWKQWSLSSQLRVFLWKNKNMFMFGGCMEDIHGYLFLKRSLKHSSYLADRNPHPSLALQLCDLPWSPLWCISWHSWDPGRGLVWPLFRVASLWAGWLEQITVLLAVLVSSFMN